MKNNPNWSRRLIYSTLAASLMVTVVPMTAGAATVVTEKAVQVEKQATQASTANESTVFEEAKISREKAIEIAEQLAGDVKGFDGPNVSRRNDRFGPSPNESRNVWEVRWMKPGPPFGHVEVVVDAETGMIRQFYKNEDEKGVSLPPKLKYEDAVTKAKEIVAKFYGEHMDQFELDPREGQDWGKVIRSPHDAYDVSFVQKINGVRFTRNQISVRITGDGEIQNIFYNTMDNVKFANTQGVLSKEEITKRLKDTLEMKLAYQMEPIMTPLPLQQKGEQPKVYLSYVPSPNFYLLDAKTGEAIDYQGQVIKEENASDKPLSATKQAEPPKKLSTPISQEEALKRLQKFIEIPKDVTISQINEEEWAGNKSWNIQFEYHTENHGMGWPGGVVDMETGEVLRFDLANYLREIYQQKLNGQAADKPASGDTDTAKGPSKAEYPISLQQAKDAALAFVTENSKDKLHQLYMSEQPVEQPSASTPFYRFQFVRKIGEVLVPYNQVGVTVSAETGKVIEFNQNWNWELQPMEVKEVVEPEKAKETYLKDIDLQLEYQIMNEKDLYDRRMGKDLPPVEAQLVYRIQPNFGEPTYLDAKTGKMLSLKTGKEVAPDKGESPVKGVQGHWAEKELNYLLEIGALQAKDGQLQPDAEMNRGEFMDMFMGVIDGHARNYYYPGRQKEKPYFSDVPATHPYFAAIEWAVERGLLEKADKFNPDAPLTREEAAKLVVRALGLSKLAEKPGMFKLDFSDRKDIDHPGEVAIVHGLGIMGGYDGEFHPDQALTRAQAAVTLFKWLEQRTDYRPEVRF